MANKAETKAVLNALLTGARPASANVAGHGPLLLSEIPESAKSSEEVIVGIDEAGRGSVLGPMVRVLVIIAMPIIEILFPGLGGLFNAMSNPEST